MKKSYTLLILLLIVNTAFSQLAIEWQKCYGGSAADQYPVSDMTNDGGLIITGSTKSNDFDVTFNHGHADIWVIKVDSLGIIEWEKSFGGSSGETSEQIIQTIDNGYVIAGNTQSNDGDVTLNKGWNDYWIIKIDSIGNLVWQRTYGGSFLDAAHSIQQTFDGGYIVAGESASNDGDVSGQHGLSDFWILKLDNIGNLLWQKCLGGSGDDRAFYIQQTIDSGYVVTGYTSSTNGDVTGNHGDYDIWVVKLDITGNIQWQKCIGGSGDEYPLYIQQTLDLEFIVGGYTRSDDGDISTPLGTWDAWIVKLNSLGNIQWEYCYGGSDQDLVTYIHQTQDSGYIVMASTASSDGNLTSNNGSFDVWILKLDKTGVLVWEENYGGSNSDIGRTVHADSNGNYFIIGDTKSSDGDITNNYGDFDFWVMKLSQITSIIQNEQIFNLFLYPNPTTSELNISFNLDNASHVNMQLYNSLGQLVKTVINEKLNAGENKINFSTGNIPPGIYHLKFAVDGNEIARKVVKM